MLFVEVGTLVWNDGEGMDALALGFVELKVPLKQSKEDNEEGMVIWVYSSKQFGLN